MSKYILVGVILFVVVLLPVVIIREIRERRKIREILQKYKDGEEVMELNEKGATQNTGWGMNNSPFRSRKSGLSWGGGNIKASEASRGTRHKFL